MKERCRNTHVRKPTQYKPFRTRAAPNCHHALRKKMKRERDRAARSVACHWTLGCGLLVLTAVGISVAALIIALEVRQETMQLQAHLGHMTATSVVDETRAADNVTAAMNACEDYDTAPYKAKCLCDQFECNGKSGTCTNAPTTKIASLCATCLLKGMPC